MSPKGKGKKKSTPQNNVSMPVPATRPTPLNLSPKLMKRFYEPLVLQHVLDPTRGNHIQCEPLDSLDESELDNCNLRRSFVRSLAYICDFEKGGATVTAIALEMRPAGVVFWVAANETVKKKVVVSLEEILKNLAGVVESVAATVEESTFRRAVELGMPRVKSYWQLMQGPLERCLKIPESEQSKGMIAWLSSFKDHKDDMLHLCRFSYDARTSPYMKELTSRSEKGYALAESNASTFLRVRHLIGRLGSHMKAARTLVAAAIRFPAFFDDFEIKCLPSPKSAKTPPQMHKLTTLDPIVVRMLPENNADVPIYKKALQDMDEKFKIFRLFVEECNRPTFLPRVHAELIVLEHFHTHPEYNFVDGDKYIGCSKPACYCCYHYICAHPGNFVRPASHNKTYLNWRPPDVDAVEDGSAATRQRDIMNDVIKMVRKDVLAQIESQRGRGRAHPDSTTGITASIVVRHRHEAVL